MGEEAERWAQTCLDGGQTGVPHIRLERVAGPYSEGNPPLASEDGDEDTRFNRFFTIRLSYHPQNTTRPTQRDCPPGRTIRNQKATITARLEPKHSSPAALKEENGREGYPVDKNTRVLRVPCREPSGRPIMLPTSGCLLRENILSQSLLAGRVVSVEVSTAFVGRWP